MTEPIPIITVGNQIGGSKPIPYYTYIAIAACIIILIYFIYNMFCNQDEFDEEDNTFNVEAAVEALRKKQEKIMS